MPGVEERSPETGNPPESLLSGEETRVLQDDAVEQLNKLVSAVQASQRTLELLLRNHIANSTTHGSDANVEYMLDPDPDCCICFDALDRPNAVVAGCGHMFHRVCIENSVALGNNSGCPICRRKVNCKNLIPVRNGLPTKIELDKPVGSNVHRVSSNETGNVTASSTEEETHRLPDVGAPRGREAVDTSDTSSPLHDNSGLDSRISAAIKVQNGVLQSATVLQTITEMAKASIARAEQKSKSAKRFFEASASSVVDEFAKRQLQLAEEAKRVALERRSVDLFRQDVEQRLEQAREAKETLRKAREETSECRKRAEEAEERAKAVQKESEHRRDRYVRLMQEYEAKMGAQEPQRGSNSAAQASVQFIRSGARSFGLGQGIARPKRIRSDVIQEKTTWSGSKRLPSTAGQNPRPAKRKEPSVLACNNAHNDMDTDLDEYEQWITQLNDDLPEDSQGEHSTSGFPQPGPNSSHDEAAHHSASFAPGPAARGLVPSAPTPSASLQATEGSRSKQEHPPRRYDSRRVCMPGRAGGPLRPRRPVRGSTVSQDSPIGLSAFRPQRAQKPVTPPPVAASAGAGIREALDSAVAPSVMGSSRARAHGMRKPRI